MNPIDYRVDIKSTLSETSLLGFQKRDGPGFYVSAGNSGTDNIDISLEGRIFCVRV